jgi:hypothetical protein
LKKNRYLVREYDLSTSKPTGNRWEIWGINYSDAQEAAIVFAKLSDNNPEKGKSVKVIYPNGHEGKISWVIKRI